ncbi:hypothetical protein LWC34_45420 [Kibdelosporangium philippinense]|uniref:LysR substrate binding domain-containing protein n=1 Tax=Kibdelosporangium philippinense TaxID=211113 RepID=A0ABS8ZSN6_9PSEU|nr:hypothetical protein [Kibdelosporangium philippinense]MCE7010000.1 hypothetical protein [Kibdelosporangium philippinense]
MSSPLANTIHVEPGTALDLREAHSVKVRIFGTTATVVHRRNDIEHERRRRAGLADLRSMELLDVLMDLPTDVAVSLSSLSSAVLRVLRRAPVGVVQIDNASVTRLVSPAVTPALAVVYASRWRDGLERASEFASYVPRMFVVPETPPNATEALAEASFYGVGVAIGPRSAPTTVLEPEPLSDWQPTTAWWWFCEQVYRYFSIKANRSATAATGPTP